MKKILSVALMLMSALCFTACGSTDTEYFTPEVTTNAKGITIELKTNMESDFEFPIEGVKFDHSKLTENSEVQYGWVIYNGSKIIGWIEDLGNGYGEKDGKYYFGFSPSYNNDVYEFSAVTFKLFINSKDTTQFDHISFTTNYGTIKRDTGEDSRGPATDIYYGEYDSELQDNKPLKGAENFSYCKYTLNFDGVDPEKVDTFKISMVISE